jgi:hypothetical protein
VIVRDQDNIPDNMDDEYDDEPLDDKRQLKELKERKSTKPQTSTSLKEQRGQEKPQEATTASNQQQVLLTTSVTARTVIPKSSRRMYTKNREAVEKILREIRSTTTKEVSFPRDFQNKKQ